MTVAERNLIDELPSEQREQLREHQGEWVALSIDPVTILAFATSPGKAYDAAQQAGVETPVVYQIPGAVLRSYYY